MPKPLIKPYPKFPLTPHKLGYWVKVIGGKQHRFGNRWCSPDEALEDYHQTIHQIKTGIQSTSPILRDALKHFLSAKLDEVEAGNIRQTTYNDYYTESVKIRDSIGANTPLDEIGPVHFSRLANSITGTPSGKKSVITRMRVFFKYCFDSGLIDRPFQYGQDFRAPNPRLIRLHKQSQPKKLFSATDIKRLLSKAKPQMKCMIYLGLFAGFGNNDCGSVLSENFDLKRGWVEFHRPKTGITRRAWLPPEAIAALKETISKEGLAFRTKFGNSWSKETSDNPISKEFRKLADDCGISLGFYALRHTCETLGGESKDQVAVDYIMGHVTPGMSSVYREDISDKRLLAVGKCIARKLGIPTA